MSKAKRQKIIEVIDLTEEVKEGWGVSLAIMSEVEETYTCMVCLDKKADTLVLPCMHSVVCRECSERLKGTSDRNKCLRCRKKIKKVLSDYD